MIPVKAVSDNRFDTLPGKNRRIFSNSLFQRDDNLCQKPRVSLVVPGCCVSSFTTAVSNNPMIPRSAFRVRLFQNGGGVLGLCWGFRRDGGWKFRLSCDMGFTCKVPYQGKSDINTKVLSLVP